LELRRETGGRKPDFFRVAHSRQTPRAKHDKGKKENAMSNKGFGVSQGKGFHMTFSNGWTVSVQWGPGNYCSNHNVEFEAWMDKLRKKREVNLEADSAEVAAWNGNGCWYKWGEYQSVKGWLKPDDVLAFMNTIAALPASLTTTHELPPLQSATTSNSAE
jgi:hypothetical protein